MELLIEQIIRYTVIGIISALSAYIIPKVTSLLTKLKDNAMMKTLIDAIEAGVKAAEQTYGPGTGAIKKQFIIDMINEKFPKLKKSEFEIDILIESIVYEVSKKVKTSKIELDKTVTKATNQIVNGLTIVDSKPKNAMPDVIESTEPRIR